MRSQRSGEPVKHGKTEQNREEVEEDEDEDGEAEQRREMSTKMLTCLFDIDAGTARKEEARRRLAEKPRGIMRWRRYTWISCSWEMKARTGRWRC